jgi:hypothetical protein
VSLIRDALERAREEAERQRAGGAPPPVRSFRRHAATPRGPWAIAAVSGLIGAALAGGGIYLAWARQPRPAETPAAATPQAPIAAIAPAATSPTASPPARVSRAAVEGPTTPQPATPAPPVAAVLPAPRSPTTAAAPEPIAPALTARSVAAAPAAERVEAPPKASPPPPSVYAGEATTPGGATMGLGGIAFSPSGPVALVNGKALGIGEGLVSTAGEAFVVEAIERDRVTLVSAGVRLVIVLR